MAVFQLRQTFSLDHRALRYSRRKDSGTTLAELLVVLVIVSVLAVVSVPVAETTMQRNKELRLRETLRDVRTALDDFHRDWKADLIGAEAASDSGWPLTLELLVDGVSTREGGTHRYLRNLPRNPFAGADDNLETQWRILGYEDPPDADTWGGRDVYDIKARTDQTALDGTHVADW